MQARRDEIADKGAADYAKEFLVCEPCQKRHNAKERAVMACALLPVSERRPGMRPFPDCAQCPGYAIALPEVLETSRALSWRRDGILRDFYDDPITPLLRDCLDILDSACKEQERESLRKMREK